MEEQKSSPQLESDDFINQRGGRQSIVESFLSKNWKQQTLVRKRDKSSCLATLVILGEIGSVVALALL